MQSNKHRSPMIKILLSIKTCFICSYLFIGPLWWIYLRLKLYNIPGVKLKKLKKKSSDKILRGIFSHNYSKIFYFLIIIDIIKKSHLNLTDKETCFHQNDGIRSERNWWISTLTYVVHKQNKRCCDRNWGRMERLEISWLRGRNLQKALSSIIAFSLKVIKRRKLEGV